MQSPLPLVAAVAGSHRGVERHGVGPEAEPPHFVHQPERPNPLSAPRTCSDCVGEGLAIGLQRVSGDAGQDVQGHGPLTRLVEDQHGGVEEVVVEVDVGRPCLRQEHVQGLLPALGLGQGAEHREERASFEQDASRPHVCPSLSGLSPLVALVHGHDERTEGPAEAADRGNALVDLAEQLDGFLPEVTMAAGPDRRVHVRGLKPIRIRLFLLQEEQEGATPMPALVASPHHVAVHKRVPKSSARSFWLLGYPGKQHQCLLPKGTSPEKTHRVRILSWVHPAAGAPQLLQNELQFLAQQTAAQALPAQHLLQQPHQALDLVDWS
mmetsp:Transcript_1312/g.4657  ORF Transcript_1312/g.4657 Transcript_1312/m.4657 type:complete len:323 (-) Transcript_1312:16-984(-)